MSLVFKTSLSYVRVERKIFMDKTKHQQDAVTEEAVFRITNKRTDNDLKSNDSQYMSEETEDEFMAVYHEKWKSFTKKLRKLMTEHPSLPVVISTQPGIIDEEADCNVAYVHDNKTGKFREKIILIHSISGSLSEINSDDYIEPPF